MFAKIVTAAGVIAALYFAFQHTWSGMVVSGVVAILAARWSETTRLLHIWRGSHRKDMPQ